jgi:hypothetical protein
MSVMKDFTIGAGGTSSNTAPSITTPPQSQTIATGSNAVFIVIAGGTAPLGYQWLFNGTNLSGANANVFTIYNVQFTNTGNYSVLVTNTIGSVTSSIAVLTVSNFPPVILAQPQNQTVNAGGSVTFAVSAGGSLPLNYQWLFNGTNNIGTNTNSYTLNNVQSTNAGNYSVLATNIGGSVTSAVAGLTVNSGTTGVVTTLAGWDVNAQSSFGPSPMPPTTNAPNLTGRKSLGWQWFRLHQLNRRCFSRRLRDFFHLGQRRL